MFATSWDSNVSDRTLAFNCTLKSAKGDQTSSTEKLLGQLAACAALSASGDLSSSKISRGRCESLSCKRRGLFSGQSGGRSKRKKRYRIGQDAARNHPGEHAAFATNSSISDLLAIHTKTAPYRTYVMTFELPRGALPDALYWDGRPISLCAAAAGAGPNRLRARRRGRPQERTGG
jgi:hypothetical protein